mgnify:CR=1 FL=1
MISRILSLDILSPDLSTCFAASADIFRLLFLVLFVGVVDPLGKRQQFHLEHFLTDTNETFGVVVVVVVEAF